MRRSRIKPTCPLFTEEIRTPRLQLRPPQMQDAEPMFQRYTRDPEVTRFLTWPPHRTLDQTRTFVQQAITGWRQGDKFAWVILRNDEPLLLGMVELRLDRFKAELGYVLARDAWGQGYMVEALQAVLPVAFSAAQIHRVWAVCDVENHASARVLEKAGLEREALLRKFVSHPNESDQPRDAYCYVMLR